jgi:NitT/TauT family transport system ATP-binding protein
MNQDGANTETELSVEHLSRHFTSRNTTVSALEDISFQVMRGEFLVIVGQSGCGKSTLLRIIQGLDKPSSGRISTPGGSGPASGARSAFVFQQDSLFPWRTVMQNVQFGLELSHGITQDTELKTRELIELVGLKGFEDHYPDELSGGMRQRVNLARALNVEPRLLLMDEPFAALDALTRENMQQELLRISAATKKTVIFITHQIDEAVLLADRVLVMSARPGRIVRTIPIDMPRPRTLDAKRQAQFQEYVSTIWNLISGAEEG